MSSRPYFTAKHAWLPPALAWLALATALYIASLYNYLLFHSLVELFTALTAFVVFVLAWHTRRILDSQPLLFLGISSLFTASLGVLHTLAYKGMGVFLGYDANLPTELWIALRYLAALSFLAAPFFAGRRVETGRTVAAYAAVTAGLLLLIFTGRFPDCYRDGSGLTHFKVYSEYLICLLFLAAFFLLRRRRYVFDPEVQRLLEASALVSVAAELAFTRYVSVFGPANLLGHFLLLGSVALLYRALVVTGVTEPARLLFRALSLDGEALRRNRDELALQVRERSDELERAKRLSDIGVLASTVAHELRNPLAAIDLAARNVRRKAPDRALTGHLDTIEKKVLESNQIINNLLFYSRLRPPHFESVDLPALLEETLDTLKECRAGAVLRVIPGTLAGVRLKADPLQLREVFNNLLNNACDALPDKGGKVEISGTEDVEHVTVTVRDNGCGIAEGDLPRVFDPFFTTKAKGTGLGLSVCRQIVDFHGGAIAVSSEPGKGTAVTIRLPR
jgi:signal transduction histidine kinase